MQIGTSEIGIVFMAYVIAKNIFVTHEFVFRFQTPVENTTRIVPVSFRCLVKKMLLLLALVNNYTEQEEYIDLKPTLARDRFTISNRTKSREFVSVGRRMHKN
jgi:hypothetical protein